MTGVLIRGGEDTRKHQVKTKAETGLTLWPASNAEEHLGPGVADGRKDSP